MTVQNTNDTETFSGNGVATSFPFSIQSQLASDVKVTHINTSTVRTTLVKDTDYSVTLNNDGTSTVIFPLSLSSFSILATGETLEVRRVVDLTQLIKLDNQGPYDPKVVEKGFDKATQMVQQIVPDMPAGADYLIYFDSDGVAQLSMTNTDLQALLSATITANGEDIIVSASALKSIVSTTLTDGEFKYLIGYYSAGDTGVITTYKWVAASTSVDDGGGVFIPDDTPSAGRWILQPANIINVKVFGAKGDRVTDDTTAILNAIKIAETVGGLYFPVGMYRCTAALPFTRSITISGANVRGNGYNTVTATNRSVLLHDFNGDFLIFDGSFATATGTGGGINDTIDIVQYYGSTGSANPSHTGPAGTAVVVKGTTTDLRAGRLKIEPSFELWNTGGSDIGNDWTYNIDIDGSGVGGSDGVRNNWVLNTRTVSGTDSIAAIRVYNAFNTPISNVNMDDRDGTGNNILLVTGPDAAGQSTNIEVSNVVGHLSVDFCTNVKWSGGRIDTITKTANATEINLMPNSINVIPTAASGMSLLTTKNGRIIHQSADSQVTRIGQDKTYAETTDTTGMAVGNLNDDEGQALWLYRNGALQEMIIRALFRNNADTGSANMAEWDMVKKSGVDEAYHVFKIAGTEKFKIDTNNAPFAIPPILPTFTVAGVPSASGSPRGLIYVSDETGGATIAFSDGTNWRRVQDRAVVA